LLEKLFVRVWFDFMVYPKQIYKPGKIPQTIKCYKSNNNKFSIPLQRQKFIAGNGLKSSLESKFLTVSAISGQIPL
jgi:hypothetical protein